MTSEHTLSLLILLPIFLDSAVLNLFVIANEHLVVRINYGTKDNPRKAVPLGEVTGLISSCGGRSLHSHLAGWKLYKRRPSLRRSTSKDDCMMRLCVSPLWDRVLGAGRVVCHDFSVDLAFGPAQSIGCINKSGNRKQSWYFVCNMRMNFVSCRLVMRSLWA